MNILILGLFCFITALTFLVLKMAFVWEETQKRLEDEWFSDMEGDRN